MARLGFNANEVAPDTGGGPIPEGRYQFQVIEEALVPTASNSGLVLKMTYEVISENYKGRKVFVNLNLANPNPVAEKIGNSELSALCHATGQMQVEDSEELLWKEFYAETKNVVENYKGKDREVTRIKKYIFGDESAPPADKAPARDTRPAPTAQRHAAPQGSGGSAGGRSLPWQGGRGGQGGGRMNDVNDDITF